MANRTKLTITILRVLTWVLFVGTCIKAGALLTSFLYTLFINPAGAKNLYLGLNLYDLSQYSTTHYCVMVIGMVLSWVLRAYILYWVIKVFMKINFMHPFSKPVLQTITNISYVAFTIGLLNLAANAYYEWLLKKGVTLSNLHEYLQGANEFLFMAGIIFVIAQVFKKGIELQTENELTV
jgi:hypothetical protein